MQNCALRARRIYEVAFSITCVSYAAVVLFAEYIVEQNNIGADRITGYQQPAVVFERKWELLGLTRFECSTGRRLLIAMLLGAMIGHERRSPDRPAGMRTMSLVCVGACLFTLASTYGFMEGPSNQQWDMSRISAAIPSGVGFLGGAVIWKGAGERGQEVRGLTTAATIWLVAAVGVCCGGHLHFQAGFGTLVIIFILKYGPRQALGNTPAKPACFAARCFLPSKHSLQEPGFAINEEVEDVAMRQVDAFSDSSDEFDSTDIEAAKQQEELEQQARGLQSANTDSCCISDDDHIGTPHVTSPPTRWLAAVSGWPMPEKRSHQEQPFGIPVSES